MPVAASLQESEPMKQVIIKPCLHILPRAFAANAAISMQDKRIQHLNSWLCEKAWNWLALLCFPINHVKCRVKHAVGAVNLLAWDGGGGGGSLRWGGQRSMGSNMSLLLKHACRHAHRRLIGTCYTKPTCCPQVNRDHLWAEVKALSCTSARQLLL